MYRQVLPPGGGVVPAAAAAADGSGGEPRGEYRLIPEARPYHPSTTVLKLNHPLMIMVQEERTVSRFEIKNMKMLKKWQKFKYFD